MLRLAKAFWDLALWRISPAQLPASRFLLALVTLAAAVLEALGALLPPPQTERIISRVALSVALPLAWAWSILYLTRHRQRFLQTAIALLGVGVLAQLVLNPLSSALDVIGMDHPASIPLGLLSFAGLVWYLLACAHIWRAALESGITLGLSISIGYLVLKVGFEQLLLAVA
ncbi:MAG: hypothetical protein ACHQIL_12535 [Steroidobacterales bacterium]